MEETAQSILFLNDFSSHLTIFLESYGSLAILTGAFLFGEVAILIAFILSGQDFFPFSSVFIFSVLGTVAADLLWYTVGSNSLHLYPRKKLLEKEKPLSVFLDKISGQYLFVSLLFLKFLFGFRLITILYMARRKVQLYQFVIFDTLGTFIFVAVISAIGWFLGRGLYNLLPAYRFLVVALFVFVFVLLGKYITKTLTYKAAINQKSEEKA